MSFIQDGADRLKAIANTPTRRALAYSVCGLIIYKLIDVATNEWLDANAWLPLVDLIRWLAGQPLGYGMLTVAALLLLAALLALIETSPIGSALVAYLARKGGRTFAVLTAEDNAEIQRLREFWREEPVNATLQATRMVQLAAEHFARRDNPFACLLDERVTSSTRAWEGFAEAIRASNPVEVPLSEVKARLIRTVKEYRVCVAWINRCRLLDPRFLNDPADTGDRANAGRGMLAMSRTDHPVFASELAKLTARAGYNPRELWLEQDPATILFACDHRVSFSPLVWETQRPLLHPYAALQSLARE